MPRRVKKLQNRIAESILTLPTTAVYTIAVWIAVYIVRSGTEQAVELPWKQLLCLTASTLVIVELSNGNALLRIRSRMVSSTFLALSSAACFLFGSLAEDFVQLCFIGMLVMLFKTYQNPSDTQQHFYGYLCIGIGSLISVHMLFFIPLLWILTATQLQSLSFRTWLASLIGIATPYWFALPWVIYQNDFSIVANHFAPLIRIAPPVYSSFTTGQTGFFIFLTTLLAISISHFWLKSYEDKIRIRLLYGFFVAFSVFCLVWICLQPQLYSILLRILIVCASPLIAHFFVFTTSRKATITFIVTIVLAVFLTILNIFDIQWGQTASFFTSIWNGLLTF